jgi:hypothetical protein
VNWTLEISGLSGGRYEVMAYALDEVGLSNESEVAEGQVLYRSLLPAVRRHSAEPWSYRSLLPVVRRLE